jgi:hypothetical protein
MTPINEAIPKQQGQRTNLNDEPLAEQVIGLRVPVSQLEIVKAKGIDWIREAIAEKLQRESLIFVSAEAKAIQRLDRLENPSNYTTLGEIEEEIDIQAISEHLGNRKRNRIDAIYSHIPRLLTIPSNQN